MSKIYLCKPGGVMLGVLTGIDENTASLKQSVSDTWELTFEVNRYVSKTDVSRKLIPHQTPSKDDFQETTYYHSVADMMELFVDDIDGAGVYFQIDSEPEIIDDGIQEKKTVTAHSIETELSTKMLHNFKINCGVKDSQEYLVGKYNDDGEFINLNISPYDGLPIDYVVVYNRYAQDLSAFKNKLIVGPDTPASTWSVDQNTGLIDPDSTFTNGEPLYPALRDLYYQFDRFHMDVKEDATWEAYLNILDDNSLGAKYNYKLYVYPGKVEVDESRAETYRNRINDIISNKYNYPTEEAYDTALADALNDYNTYLQNDVYDQYKVDSFTQERLIEGFNNLIAFYEEYGKQLSLVDLALENAKLSGWQTNIDYIPKEIAYKKYTFNIDNQDILSFFKTNCTKTMKVIFDFDRLNKVIKIIDIQNEGNSNDTGIFLTFRNLVNEVNIKTSSTDGIRTRFVPTGNNGLGITYVNFGENNIIDLSWFMDKVNEYGDLQYVTPELRNRYFAWLDFRDKPYLENGEMLPSRREQYIELTKQYNALLKDINELTNKLPIDDCEIDFTTYTLDELNQAYTAYLNAYDVIKRSYMADVHAVEFDDETLVATDAQGNPCTSIRETFYWYDFICYRDTIIPNVLNALLIYVYTDDGAHDTLKVIDEIQYHYPTAEYPNGYWIGWPGGNPSYNADAKVVTENQSDAYVYDMDLYGPVELQAKINAWISVAGVQYKKGFILDGDFNVIDTPSPDIYGRLVEVENSLQCAHDHEMYATVYVKYDALDSANTGVYYKTTMAIAQNEYIIPGQNATKEYRYNTPDADGWDRLRNGASGVQDTFNSKEAFYEYLNEYLDYVSPEIRPRRGGAAYGNQVNKQDTEGVIPYAQAKLQELNDDISAMEDELITVQENRKKIAEEVSLEKYFEQYPLELKTIQTMLRESNYNNSNILTTNLDDIVTAIDKQKELLDDAVIALSEKSQPQLSFEIGLDNLYALDEYKPMRDSIGLLKYIRVSTGLFNDDFKKLRIISITCNPLIPTEELQLEFSNMTYSLQGANDFAHLFDDLGGGEGGSSGSGSGSSGGTYGTNDSEITISNNILSALLRSKSYTNSIGSEFLGSLSSNPVLQNQVAVAGLFDKLETGMLRVHGACITDYIQSKNYVASTSSELGTGSSLNLKDGTFDYAGGNLTYNGSTLHVKGDIEITDWTSIDNEINAKIEDLTDDLSSNSGTTVISGRHISTGTLLASTIKGGTLSLGGSNNTDGTISMKNASGNQYGLWDVTSFKPNANAEFKADGTVNLTVNTFKIGDKSLGTAAYEAKGAFDTAGAASGVQSNLDKVTAKFTIVTSGSDAGVYVHENSSYNSGANIKIQGNGLYLRQGTSAYITMDTNGIELSQGSILTKYVSKDDHYTASSLKDGVLYFYYHGSGETTDKIGGYISGSRYMQIYSPNGISESVNVGNLSLSTYSGYISIRASKNSSGYYGNIDITGGAGYIRIGSEVLADNNGIYIGTYDGDITIAPTSGKDVIMPSVYANQYSSDTANVRIESEGALRRRGSSSKRYKHDISYKLDGILDSHKLYDIPVASFIYNDDYLNPKDERYQKVIPGFIAEDIEKIYPIACDHENQLPEDWNYRYLLPPMLALIQEQHKDIENLKNKINELKEKTYE